MRYIDCLVSDEYVKGAGVPVGAEGSHNDVALRLTFESMWDGTTKSITWLDAMGEHPTITMITENMRDASASIPTYIVPIPAEPKRYKGKMSMSIKGAKTSGSRETSATMSVACDFIVLESKYDPNAAASADINPTIAEQIQSQFTSIASQLQQTTQAASNAQTYAQTATTKANEAKSSADRASASANSADSAKNSAEDAARRASASASEAGSYASNAISSAGDAVSASNDAIQAKNSAEIYASEAGESADSAREFAEKVETMTVTSEVVEDSYMAGVRKDDTPSGINLHFKLPLGSSGGGGGGLTPEQINQLNNATSGVESLTSRLNSLTADDVGARPADWMPTYSDVGARPATWIPTAEEVGARPNTWTPTAEEVGARPNTWMPTAEDVGAVPLHTNVNPNLLDNWYFANPVNQRGQTEYTTTDRRDVAFDRWKIGYATATLGADGVTITASTDNYGIVQYIETASIRVGAPITFSALTASGALHQLTTNWGTSKSSSWSDNVRLNLSSDGAALRTAWIGTPHIEDGSITIVAAKLEYGTQQTLAHQEDGVWVLNETPDYATELLKCQRYLYVIKTPSNYADPLFNGFVSTATTARFYTQLPTQMRSGTPTVTRNINESAYKLYSNGTSYNIDSASYNIRGNRVYIHVTSSGMQPYQSAAIVASGTAAGVDGEILISREL